MTYQPPPGFIPPFQDIATLSAHVCLSEHTIERMMREGKFPQPCKISGKRLWSWKQVEACLMAADNEVAQGEAIREATVKAFSRG